MAYLFQPDFAVLLALAAVVGARVVVALAVTVLWVAVAVLDAWAAVVGVVLAAWCAVVGATVVLPTLADVNVVVADFVVLADDIYC